MTTFQKAVSETKALYEEAKRLHGDDLNAAFNENKKEFWADVHKWDLETLIERSVSDAEIFDILIRSISKKLEEQKLLCALSRDWLVKFLRGEVERPKEIAGRKDTFGRDSFIVYAIQRLKNQGMPSQSQKARSRHLSLRSAGSSYETICKRKDYYQHLE